MKPVAFLLSSFFLLAACGGRQRGEGDDRFGTDDIFEVVEGEGAARIEQVALTDEIDSITFSPAGTVSRSWPSTTQRLFLCFRLRGAGSGQRLVVEWFRSGEQEPLSMTNDTIDGDGRLAAEHVAERPFWPGPHFVRVSLDDQELTTVEFQIEGSAETEGEAALRAVKIANFGLYSALDRAGRPRGQPTLRFPLGTKRVHAAFRVVGAPPETRADVVWLRAGQRQASTELGLIGGDRSLSATLQTAAPLPAGAYLVEVQLNGVSRSSLAFNVGDSRGRAEVSGLQLTTAINERSRRPTAPVVTRFEGTERSLYLCLAYRGFTQGQIVEVRWVQDSHPEAPMAVSTIRVQAEGNLAASFSPDTTLPGGSYHVDVVSGGEVLSTLAFTVGL